MSSFPTILQRLAAWAELQPDKKAWSFLDDKGNPVDDYTYRQLDRASTSVAYYLLHTCKLKKGDRALLVFFPGLHFMISLLGCFKAGIIAVPVFPPDPTRLAKDIHHFISIQSSSGSTVALSHSLYNFAKKVAGIKSMFSMSNSGSAWPDLTWVLVDDVISRGKAKAKEPGPAIPPPPSGSDIAFLQYTSGSTSEPKGVMISHDNLAHNETLITRELKADVNTVCVSWLPQYHDMGLIGSYLGALYCGGTGYYLSPISFLKDPMVWIRSLSRFRGTHTQAPNFAYALVARKFRESRDLYPAGSLDLSSLQHMINAAEPVDDGAVQEFYSIFSSDSSGAGFSLPHGVVVPTYGLAEHTVFVCSGGTQCVTVKKASLQDSEKRVAEVVAEGYLADPSSYAADGSSSSSSGLQTLVGCGYPMRGEGVSVLIVDEASLSVLGEGSVGEVWVQSPSKAMGYWGRKDLTDEDFHAFPSDTDAQRGDGYLRTGDLGFMHRDELFICGRLKDLIIVRGSNHYPQDIERTVEKCDNRIRAGCTAAFAMKSSQGDNRHTEGVVLVAELKEGSGIDASDNGLDVIIKRCRESVAREHGLGLTSVCLIKIRTIAKTTSGKIARSWCKKAYSEGKLQILRRWDGNPSEVEDVDFDEATATGENNLEVVDLGNDIEGGDEGRNPKMGGGKLLPKLTVAEVRSLSHEEIASKIEVLLVQICAQGPSPLLPPIDPDLPLVTLGLDSMTIVQLKGVIERKFYCEEVPDEFFFTEMATLTGIAQAVKIGRLTEEQKSALQQISSGGADGSSSSDHPIGSTVIPKQKQPFCPWWTCCY